MRHLSLALLASALAGAAAVGCYTGSPVDSYLADDPTESEDATVPSADGGAKPKKGSVGDGIPCDVAELLEAECNGCHGPKLAGGAPNRLVSYNDLATVSESDPTRTVAAVSLARMKSSSRPMPPDGRLPSSKIAAFERWVKERLPRGTCENDATLPPSSPPPTPSPTYTTTPPPPPGPQPTVCTSGNTTPQPKGPLMKPGASCAGCHGGDRFTIAGTVYPTIHEPNDCHGLSGTVVVITDATGKEIRLTSNASGNFSTDQAITPPYRARVIRNGQERAMGRAQTNGDCNSCHTEKGAGGAPGRVMAP